VPAIDALPPRRLVSLGASAAHRGVPPGPTPARGGRLAPLAAIIAAVLLVHGWLVLGWPLRDSTGIGAPLLQLRQIVLPAPALEAPATTDPPASPPAPVGAGGSARPTASAAGTEASPTASEDWGRPAAVAPAAATTRPSAAPRTALPPADLAADPAAADVADAGDPFRTAPGSGSSAADAAAADLADALAAPAHETDMPPPWRLHYDLQRGSRSGHAVLHWQRDPGSYRLEMGGRIEGTEPFGWASRGHFDGAGIAPERFVVRRRGRDAAAVNFRRDAAPAITFSGPSVALPLPAGVQDRATWLVQLAAVVRALPQPVLAGQQVVIPVAGPRGDLAAWRFGAGAVEFDAAPDGQPRALQRWHRPGLRPRDLDVQVWLDPARGQLPVRIRIEARPHGGATEWRLRAAEPG
jgi:hypothetical protein